MNRRAWAQYINRQWHGVTKTTVEGFLRVGQALIDAKAELPHGEFIAMIREDLEMKYTTANAFKRIAEWVASDIEHVQHLLPPDWGTILKITRLDEVTFLRLVKDGTISPDLRRNEISKILRLQRVAADEQRVLQLRPIVGKFRTLVIDPAWDYDWLSIAARAKPGYAMQTQEMLRALDVKAWADDSAGCHLYLWATNNFIYEAGKLVEYWGFQHRTVLTWIKPPPFGLGSYFRNSTEQVIFATRGKTTTRPAAASIPTHFEAPRGEHSEKPEAFYKIVRKASYPPYGEANQRQKRRDFKPLFCPITELQEAAE